MIEAPTAVELDKIGETLRLYAKALSGREIHLVPVGAMAVRGAGWATPSQDKKTVTVRLPAKIARFSSQRENFDWYKITLTHQAGHFEFGSFDFDFAKPSRLFDDWRMDLADRKSLEGSVSSFAKLWQLFPDVQLGRVIFEQVEDARIDAQILAAYPGVRPLYRRIADLLLAARPGLSVLALREAFLEALVQLGLGGEPMVNARREISSEVALAGEVIGRVRAANATVEDSAEATLRLYELAARLPNRPVDERNHEHEQSRTPREHAPEELSEPVAEAYDAPFSPPMEVEFRLDNQRHRLYELDSAEAQDVNVPAPADLVQTAGALTRDQPFTYLYPEWDFRAGAYRHDWCRVREHGMEEGTSDFYVETLAEHRPLIAQVTQRFEHFVPELFRKVARRYDGEDLDLDGVIEQVIDRRTGTTPAEKIYWRRERTQRDVAVALVLDMSATTQEFVQLEAAKAHRPSGPSAQAYSDYLKRIAAGVDDRGKPLRRRAIDIEKQAAVVLCQALEKIGDSYALYAFSGSGRAEVEFHVIKAFDERLSQRISRRIDRIEPAHGTRMGAAIRHAIRKLERVEANTRLLFLLSDGRPYDRDYGEDDQDQEYAVQDTRQALLEAKRRRIRPFCLTIDRDGEDYLRKMCDEIPYEVVTKVEELPIRLVAVYPNLTA